MDTARQPEDPNAAFVQHGGFILNHGAKGAVYRLSEGFLLDLPDAPPGQPVLPPHFVQRPNLAVVQSNATFEYVRRARV